MADSVVIAERFNGPPGSANGGYCCGMLAAFIDGPARVRLHSPPPLDTPMSIVRNDDGTVAMQLHEQLVGSAEPASLELHVPGAPSPAAAREASAAFVGHRDHSFPSCYVCGPQRPHGDGLALFSGAVGTSGIVASTWTPAQDTLDLRGNVLAEIVWAALDCPGYFAAMGSAPRPAVLGELTGELRRAVPGGETLVVYAWPISAEGRKHYAGSAVASNSGEVLACARSTWIELRQ